MSPVQSVCEKDIFSEYLDRFIEVLIIKLESDVESHFPDIVTVKDKFESVLALINSTSEVTPVKSSCKFKIILKKLLKHGKLSSVSPTDRSSLLDLCKILLQFMNNDDLIATVNEFIEHTHLDLAHQTVSKFTKSDINLFTFYAIDILLNSLEAKHLQWNSMDCLERIVIDVVLCCDNDVLCVILHHLIPNLIRFSNSSRILEEIWLSLQRDCFKNAESTSDFIKCHDEQCLSRKVSILCMLAQYYISSEKNSFPLVTKEHFWFIIYCGLIDSLPLHRKKALYLLKRSVDFLEVNCLTFNCNFFIWNVNHVSHLQEIWKDIIIVLEVLEEKQLHLINPILPNVMKLTVINNVVGEELLKDNWLKCVCRRLMSHESSQLVKWGIVNLICADAFFHLEYDPTFYRIIFNALNNTSLFSKNQGKNSFAVGESLKNWFLKFSYQSDKTFFKNILNLFCDISWAPVPLFYVVQALATTPKTDCWDTSTLIILKKFIIETLGTQNVHIRGAIQCCLLRCVINLTDTRDLDYRTVFDLLSVIRSSECLRRGTQSWKMLVIWLKQFIEAPRLLTFLKTEIDGMLLEQNTHDACLSMEAISRCVILMSDIGLFCGESKTPQIFTPILNLFNHTSTSNSKPVDRALMFLMNLVIELETVATSKNDVTKELVFSLALKCVRSAMSYMEIGFKNWFGYTKEISTLQQYLSFISCFGSCEDTKTEMKESVLKLVMDSYNVLADDRLSNPSLKYFSLMLVSWVAKYNCSQYKQCSSVSSNGIIAKSHQVLVEKLMKEQQINKILQGEDLKSCNDSMHSKFSSSCVLAGWNLLHSYIVAFEKSLYKIKSLLRIEQLIELGLEATQIGGKDVLTEINQVFEVVLPEFINELETETLSKFISTTWNACFELRKNELFWIIFKSWIKMFYQKTLMENENCNKLQIEYAYTILELGETVGGLSNCLFKHLNEEIYKHEDLAKLPNDLLVKALVFGPVHRKDLRIESEVCNFIKSKGSEYSINILKPLTGDRDDCEVRLYVLNLILKVCIGENGEITSLKILISVMESLMDEDSRISEKKKRYYGDSHHHRVKNRIVQVLLVLEYVLLQSLSSASEVLYEKLLEWLSDNLSRESHQPSIRYQLQWLFVRCLLHKPRHLPKFWIMFEKGSEERAGCVCSYISIAYHLAVVLQHDEFSSRCVQEILPWCMAQHFNVRMYAQFVLSKLCL
ncbi:hypothetical protein LSTR_LSTR012854 [Laodelphax striatellus]|uniref:Uncharacterized protein n=1 Tax=Laodelphax striatellus TaxID=195883 RepID=A0A482XPB6_LAOST|nr:hypothetical protein LSTR_LSTR012854 [Laodelphax striatellus]